MDFSSNKLIIFNKIQAMRFNSMGDMRKIQVNEIEKRIEWQNSLRFVHTFSECRRAWLWRTITFYGSPFSWISAFTIWCETNFRVFCVRILLIRICIEILDQNQSFVYGQEKSIIVTFFSRKFIDRDRWSALFS